MLSGSRGDSTSVTKYPYVSPLSEAPSRLECYWYVDVGSRAETIGAPFESIMSAANASHPFSIPFSVFPPDCLCLCMSGWLPKGGYAAVCLLYPAATVAKYRSTRVTLEYPLPSSLSVSFFFSLPCHLLISSLCSQLRSKHPQRHEQVVYSGAKGILYAWFRFSKLCLLAIVRSHRRTSFLFLFSSGTFESFLRLFTYYRTHFHSSIVLCLLGISFRHIGRKPTFPICSRMNKLPQDRSANFSNKKTVCIYVCYQIFI